MCCSKWQPHDHRCYARCKHGSETRQGQRSGHLCAAGTATVSNHRYPACIGSVTCGRFSIHSPFAVVVVVTFTSRHVSLQPAASGLFIGWKRGTGSEPKAELGRLVWCWAPIGLQVLQWRETGGDDPAVHLPVCSHLTSVSFTTSAEQVSASTAFSSLRKHLKSSLKVVNVGNLNENIVNIKGVK